MQSAPRAVTCSRQASRHSYTSSRHALGLPACYAAEPTTCLSPSPSLPATIDHPRHAASSLVLGASSVRCHSSRRNASVIVLSQPATQKRCASSSSKPRPPAAGLRSKPNEKTPTAAKPMVYTGRDAAVPSRILSSNPYMRGNFSPAASPNTIFDPKKSRPSIVIRPPLATPTLAEDAATPPPASDRVRISPIALPDAKSPPTPTATVPPSNAPSIKPSSSPQKPLRLAPDRDLAYAVDDVAVPKGVTQSDEAQTTEHPQRIESTESRASAFDQLLRLEQKNSSLTSALAKQRKDYQELQEALQRLQASSIRTIQDVQMLELQARKKMQAQSSKFEKDRSDFQSTISQQEAKQNQLSRQLAEVRKELADERDSSTQRHRRLYNATVRVREQEESSKAARKLLRKDYKSFQEWAHERVRKTVAILRSPEQLRLKATWYKREAVYWTNALKATQSFQGTAKGGDQFRIWEAGQQVQQKTRDSRERDALRQQLVHGLEQRLQHRDSVFEQVKGYLQDSGLEADRAKSEYLAQLAQLQDLHKTILSRQHDWRRLVRENRFSMDPKTSSPEVTAASRASTIDLYEMDRPISDISGALYARLDFWRGRLQALKAQDRYTVDTDSTISFYKTQIRALIACSSLMGMIRTFSALQLEALEADWISDQPTYQQLFWQNLQRMARRATHTKTSTTMVVNDLMKTGVMGRHKILSMKHMPKIMNSSKLHERAAFAYAYVKHKQKAFTPEDLSEISDVFAVYRHGNQQESKRYLRQLEPLIRSTDEISDVRHGTTLGKRLLVPARARTRRRETLRKVAFAKTKHDEDTVEGQATPTIEAAAGTTTDIPRSAVGVEMTSKSGSTANLEKSKASQPETTQSPKKDTKSQSKNTTSPGPAEASANSTEESPQAEIKPRGPAFKLIKQGFAPIPRLTPKAPAVYSRARSKIGFRPPKPMFKETRRRSQIMGDSAADCLDKEELGRSTEWPPLLYRIPPQDLRNALMASKTSQAAFWRYSLYKSPSGEKPRLHYCTKFEQAEQVAKLFSEERVIGFDIEWEMGSTVTKSSIKDNVSLIQIACDDRIALFQVALFAGDSKEELMPPSLKAILESPGILKTGVNISGDFTRLRKCLGVEGQGIFELSHLYKLVKFSEKEPAKVNKMPFKLAEQVQDVLFLPLHKGNVRTSAWSRRLDMEQVVYAASDAYAGFRLFRELEKARTMMSPTPPRPALWELDQPIILGNGERVGQARTKRKIAAITTSEVENQPPTLSVDEEQALNDEEDEAAAEAGADDIEDDNDQNELESLDVEPAAIVKHEAAEQWLDQCQSELPQRYVRAYALWQVQGLELQQVAEAMREPPLARTTVASYILEVVKSDRLPYEPARLQAALDVLPSVGHWRYKSLMQKTRSEI
ncbi:ribonuclease H-like protein, partial [Aureobasidium sp. EXF-3399]